MNTIDQINSSVEAIQILKALGIPFTKRGVVLKLHEKGVMTDGWIGHATKGIFTDQAKKGRAEGDKLKFVQQYLGVSKHEALKWFEEQATFDIKVTAFAGKKQERNPIKDKWDSLGELNDAQIQYLKDRKIEYSLLDGIVRNNNGRISAPIRAYDGFIKTLQNRTVDKDEKIRYMVERNTDSDGLFFDSIDFNKKALIVVEGFTDYLSLRQYTSNVVGLFNAISSNQLQMIKEFSKDMTIFFVPDNDSAGLETVKKFQELGIRFNHFKLETYGVKDINELLVSFDPAKEILDFIFHDSEKPMSNLRSALVQAKEYKSLYEENDGHLGFPSGYDKIDKEIDGIIKGKAYLLMAFSNLGKTRFMYSLVKNMFKLKKKVHIYSLEVDRGMLFVELVGCIFGLSREEVMSGIDDIDIDELEQYIEIYDSVRDLEGICNNISNGKPDVAVIDFVQNIECPGQEYEKMTTIALRIQKTAILTGTTMFSLSQVGNESRFADGNNIMPKGSGALFASSDVILALWKKNEQKFLTISKNKYGPAGKTFAMEIDYAKSEFNLADDIYQESANRFVKK